MKRIYIFIYSESAGSREQIKKWLNEEKLILNWRYDMPNCFYLISESNASSLSKSFITFNGRKGRHIITEIANNRQGLLPKESWSFMKMMRYKTEPLRKNDLIYFAEYQNNDSNKLNEINFDRNNINSILSLLNSLKGKNNADLTQKTRRICEWMIHEYLPNEITERKDVISWISDNYVELSKKYPNND